MANEELLDRLQASIAAHNGCVAWNQWQQGHDDMRVDLRSAPLRGADLGGAHLMSVDLTGADLSHAHLRDAILIEANLRDTNLRGADLEGADLESTDLENADFEGADLKSADLKSANLKGVNFTDIVVGFTQFDNIDFRHITGLATVKHYGPSTIGIDTIYRSRGEIPDVFLRGCGVPDDMIGFVHSIAGAIQYYSAFISYNHEDEAFATRLYNDLQANNVRCWKYTEDVKIGNDILARVDEAIRLHEKLVVIFSEHSVQSDWVAAEVEAALAREEREDKEILFPVTIDDAVKHTHFGWAAKIRRQRNMGDFTAWKDQDQYQPKFDRLLRDLKADSR